MQSVQYVPFAIWRRGNVTTLTAVVLTTTLAQSGQPVTFITYLLLAKTNTIYQVMPPNLLVSDLSLIYAYATSQPSTANPGAGPIS